MYTMLTLGSASVALVIGCILLGFRLFESGRSATDDEHQLIVQGAARPRQASVER